MTREQSTRWDGDKSWTVVTHAVPDPFEPGRWIVVLSHNGETLVLGSDDPEKDAAVVLQRHGFPRSMAFSFRGSSDGRCPEGTATTIGGALRDGNGTLKFR